MQRTSSQFGSFLVKVLLFCQSDSGELQHGFLQKQYCFPVICKFNTPQLRQSNFYDIAHFITRLYIKIKVIIKVMQCIRNM